MDCWLESFLMCQVEVFSKMLRVWLFHLITILENLDHLIQFIYVAHMSIWFVIVLVLNDKVFFNTAHYMVLKLFMSM